MQFSAKEDIEAPIKAVFAGISDFDSFERAALRRGATVQRTSPPDVQSAGMTWNVGFLFRGKPRALAVELVQLEPPHQMTCHSTSGGLDGNLIIDVMALSAGRTRLTVDLKLQPRTLSARLLVQSLKLARTNLNRRFAKRVAAFASEIEGRQNPQLA